MCVCMRDDDVFLMTDLVLCLGRHCVFVLCDATETVREWKKSTHTLVKQQQKNRKNHAIFIQK